MTLFGKKIGNKRRQRKAPIRLAVEYLEDRVVPAGNLTHMTSHLSVSPLVSEKAMLVAAMPGNMQDLGRAAATASSLAQLTHSINSQTDNGSQGTMGKDPLDKLVDWEQSNDATLKLSESISRAERSMEQLADALRAAGVSDHDIQRLLGQGGGSTPSSDGASSSSTVHGAGGGSNSSSIGGGGKMPSQQEVDNSPFLSALFNRQDDGSADWVQQLPFLSVTQGQDPIQVGSAYNVDPRTAVSGDATSQTYNEKTGVTTITYKDGTATVDKDGNVTFHDADSTTQVTRGADGDTVVTTTPNGMVFTDRPNGQSTIEGPNKVGGEHVTMTFDSNGTLIAFGYKANDDSSERVYDMKSGEWTLRISKGEIDEIWFNPHDCSDKTGSCISYGGKQPRPDGPIRPDPMGIGQGPQHGFVITNPNYRKILQMPNPEADDHPPAPAGIPDMGAKVELRDPDHSHSSNIDKFVGSIVGHINSKVNPAPDSAGGHTDEATSVGNGYHVGISPPEYDQLHSHLNSHPGGKPIDIIIGGPGPKVN
ncbi:MAG TPA: hypothetical protein VGZ47_17020 [Gemmataceae bacterium]|nr:hypothetical protein [Gemmataceae bacterium]